MIRDFKPRLYQETILGTAVKHNTLVVLPTGMGKTGISLLLAAERLKNYPKSKILVLAPTRPLVQQHLDTFKRHLDVDNQVFFTGMVSPEKRAEMWKDARVVFSTPQGLENDIISERILLDDVSLLVFDECHRAVGDYAYVFIAKQYAKKSKYPRILGLTASPGSDLEKIKEILSNLHIEEIEIRTDEDPDVKPYIQEIDIKWVKVELPPLFSEIQGYLKDLIKDRLGKLKKWGILRRRNLLISKTDLLAMQAELRRRASSGEKDYVLWNAISVLAEVMKVSHGLELLETQGIVALYRYLDKLRMDAENTKVKAVKNIVKDLNFRSAFIKTEKLFKDGFQHPKLIELQRIIEQEIKKDVKIMVFNQYRDNASDIVRVLNSIKGVKAELFVGQIKKGETGLSQKEQKEILDKFRAGEFNVLVATSVGEEGLDIPKVDLVVFYEPIPSAIRHIQRRGRTGRQEKGRVVILMTKNTRDEGYRWSAHHKEQRMYRNLSSLKKKISIMHTKPQQKLSSFVPSENRIKIFADYREKGSNVIKELVELNAELRVEKLNADYILSDKVGVEFKTIEDFCQSIIDGRLLEQVKFLKENFERPLIMVEGDADIYSQRNIHPNAIRGMLATIAVSYGVPILYTKNFKDTASLLYIIAKREQEGGKEFSMHPGKKVLGLKEMQEYVVSAFPSVGPLLAKELLKQFGSVKDIVNADASSLREVEKIGEKIAKNIRDVLDSKYV
jgi:Fanconi anemia group M protein